MAVRVTQIAVQSLQDHPRPNVRVTQEAVQVLYAPSRPTARVTQTAVQVLYTLPRPSVRVTQNAVQVLHNDTTNYNPPYAELPGSVRDTQANAQVLGEGSSDARVTQSSALVLSGVVPPTRITQSNAQVLAGVLPDSRITQSAVLVLADHTPCLTQWCQAWTIRRKDGVVMGFTSHDKDIVFRGVTHKSCDSLLSSATSNSTEVGSTGNVDVSGIISSTAITEADLYNGVYDSASVEVWNVPWSGTDSPFLLMQGIMGTVEQSDIHFVADVTAQSVLFQTKPLLDVYSPSCRWSLGDDNCKVSLSGITVSGSVTAVGGKTGLSLVNKRAFTDSSRLEATGAFDQGAITWTSGNNIGAVSEVKDFDSGAFVLWDSLLYQIEVGDSYNVHIGCNKSKEDCKSKFNNFNNFGGFPHVPGQDKIVSTPDSK